MWVLGNPQVFHCVLVFLPRKEEDPQFAGFSIIAAIAAVPPHAQDFEENAWLASQCQRKLPWAGNR